MEDAMTQTPRSNHIELMIDIETMSARVNASILTIGATYFDPRTLDTEEQLREQSALFGPISFQSNEKEGRHFSPQTMEWWLQQSQEAQAALFEGNILPLRAALEQFRQWVINLKPAPSFIWANSPSFDCAIVHNAMDQLNMMWPFKFWEERDVRTIRHLAYPDGDHPNFETGTAHNAVDDCIKQVLLVQHCATRLGVYNAT